MSRRRMGHYYRVYYYMHFEKRWAECMRSPVSSLKEARRILRIYPKARIIKVTEQVIK